jgi:enoyl-CoA hydratase
MAYETITTDRSPAGVTTIALNRPEQRNAFSAQLLEELLSALAEAREDPHTRAVVLASTDPRVFSAGADLSAFGADLPPILKHFGSERFPELFQTLIRFPKPTLCSVGGIALAGSVGLVLACDLVVASNEATFGLPEINVGAFPFMVMALLYRNVPRKKATELLLLGERIDAQTAQEIGIVNKVVPPDQLAAATTEWAERLASRSLAITRLGKEAIAAQQDMTLEQGLAYLRGQLSLALTSEDAQEGVKAFFERRKPQWRDR